MSRSTTLVFGMRALISGGVALALGATLACSRSDRTGERVAQQQQALACDLKAPFGPIAQVFSGALTADGFTLSADERTAYV